jgi:hypothetical protein
MKKMKAYIIYGGAGDLLNASLILENGWSPFGRAVKSVQDMKGELWGLNMEAQEVFKRMEIELEITGDPIYGSANAPEGLLDLYRDRSNYQEMADEYAEFLDELRGTN